MTRETRANMRTIMALKTRISTSIHERLLQNETVDGRL